jgi:Uma2 family endonuclease
MNKILTMPAVDRLDPQGIPPLESGDRLTREEFERRYNAMPMLKKAELIEGVVYMASAVPFVQHGVPHFDLIAWLGMYRMATPGVQGADNSTLRLSLLNEPQPDAALLILPAHGGRAQIDPDDYITGGPELLGEVAASSASYDLHDKLDAYRRNGVVEYVVWRVYEQAIDWFVRRNELFVPLPVTPDGLYQSEVFPGLWLDPAALVRGDMARVMEVLQQGLASPEHAAFRARLQQAAASTQR